MYRRTWGGFLEIDAANSKVVDLTPEAWSRTIFYRNPRGDVKIEA